jgi:subtilisin family serine protease
MATIIHEVAPDAELYAVRVTDKGAMALWDVLAGTAVAAIDCAADITNLSLGLPDLGGSPCPWCLSQAHVRSLAFEKLLDALAKLNPDRPIWAAATGNDGRNTGFHCPAAYTAVLAAGSVNAAEYRSQFSNYGTQGHAYYLMAPAVTLSKIA